MNGARFEGKVIVITGAAGGVGLATAERFGSEGARVVVVDLPSAPLQDAVAAVEKAGGHALAVGGDVTRQADVEAVMARAMERFSRIDFCFNNAGIGRYVGSLVDHTKASFDLVMDVNVKGVWLGMKAVAPAPTRSTAE